MELTENQWDKQLRVKTAGFDEASSDNFRYRYEPTPYPVLELLANSGYLDRDNVLLDYGCGKGRVALFLSHMTKCRAVGIEYDGRMYRLALANRETAASGRRTEFVQADAAEYAVPPEVDRCFFFNPFSVEVFRKVYARLLESYYERPREILLFFYYISEEYLEFILGRTDLHPVDEIDCTAFPIGDRKREKIMIFSLDLER